MRDTRGNTGIAVSPDGAHMAISNSEKHTVSVFSLPIGTHERTIGSRGNGQLQFDGPGKLCFNAAGNILVAEWGNRRVQEVTVAGVW